MFVPMLTETKKLKQIRDGKLFKVRVMRVFDEYFGFEPHICHQLWKAAERVLDIKVLRCIKKYDPEVQATLIQLICDC